MSVELWLVRHGETEWSLSGKHTSRTDVPLTEQGRRRAERLRDYLKGTRFDAVFVSPMQRARETCEIAGLSGQAVVDDGLKEWDYGIYEGRTTAEIQKEQPGWSVWTSEIVDGETVEHVGERADLVIARALAAVDTSTKATAMADGVIDRALRAQGEAGRVILFAHAHILRILAARWVKLPATDGALLALGTGSVSVLGWERETRVIERWNREFNS
jgi:broad specificity phosphatase PhoE